MPWRTDPPWYCINLLTATLTTIKKLSVLDLEFPENPDDSKMKHTFALIGQLSTRLEDLTLSGTISDEQIAALSSLVNLKSLSFSNVRSITLASVPVLRHLTALKTLEMPYQWDAGPDLAGLTQLKVLNATGDGLNTLEDLEGLVNLELVDLGEIPAGHVGHIGACTNLHALTIYRMPSHASISRWTALQRLEYLDLSDGTITPTVLKGVLECLNLRSIHIEDGAWLDWDLVQEDMFANVSRLTNLVSLCDLKHHPVFDNPISRLPDSLTCLEIISDNGQMREQFFANIRHLTNLKSLTFSYAQGGKNALNSAIIEGLAVLTALETLHIGNNRYNDEFYPICREMVRMTGPAAAAFLEQYASHTSSFPQVSLAAFSSLTSLCELSVDLDPFFEDQVRALTTLTNLKKVKFGKHFATADFFTLIGQPVPQDNDDHEYIMEAE